MSWLVLLHHFWIQSTVTILLLCFLVREAYSSFHRYLAHKQSPGWYFQGHSQVLSQCTSPFGASAVRFSLSQLYISLHKLLQHQLPFFHNTTFPPQICLLLSYTYNYNYYDNYNYIFLTYLLAHDYYHQAHQTSITPYILFKFFNGTSSLVILPALTWDISLL